MIDRYSSEEKCNHVKRQGIKEPRDLDKMTQSSSEEPMSCSSIYPLHPSDSETLLRISQDDLTAMDRARVAFSSLFMVGSIIWVPFLVISVWRKWREIPKENKPQRMWFSIYILTLSSLFLFGPHRHPRVGKWLGARKWWAPWLRFIAMEVIRDYGTSNDNKALTFDHRNDKAIVAFVPHGIFPFAFGFGVGPDFGQKVFGFMRPVVATATAYFPVVNTILRWIEKVDASKDCVDRVLQEGTRIAIIPGGIAEIFEGYPKPNTNRNEEYAIVRRGFLRLAIKHGIPVLPIYCFGATKMFKRLEIPLLEKLSLFLRISICVFFGVWGLPIPFRQRLSYVIGRPIFPPDCKDPSMSDQHIFEMHQSFCDELVRIFERHKRAYGWGHKSLKLLER